MLYKNTKAMVHSSAGDTDFFDIVTRDLARYTLALYQLLSAYALRKSKDLIKENNFTFKKDAEYADDLALLTYTHTQAESLHGLDLIARDIGFYCNSTGLKLNVVTLRCPKGTFILILHHSDGCTTTVITGL